MILLYELNLLVYSLAVVEVIYQVFRPLLLMKVVNILVMSLHLILQRKKIGLQIQNIVKRVVQLILEWLASKIKSHLNSSALVQSTSSLSTLWACRLWSMFQPL